MLALIALAPTFPAPQQSWPLVGLQKAGKNKTKSVHSNLGTSMN